jgi:dTDP-3-amino-2,3,6-trideoxy-4-keto-D-glucose/dTDP-3-amino-3,4,6-trideoxy-alpha-D-glucose/dTDP-2,6-dideoxy-D-kanosamine transaminase
VTIPVWDYRREYEQYRDGILSAIDKVFRSGRLILGESVRNFEQSFASYCSVSHGVGVNSGTDALFLALKALGIRNGDEVITVANTAVPTVSAIVSAGGIPRFVDIDPETYLMDVTKLEKALTPRTRCVLPVHLYGQCVNMDAVMAFAQEHGLKVLEDCAQSAGALYKGRRAGSLGHAAAFSFYPTKTLGGYGDGGMVVTGDQAVADRVRRLRMYGMAGTYYSEEHGYNSRLDEVQAEILTFKLPYLDEWIAERRRLAENYHRRLSGALVLPREAEGNYHAYYVYVVRDPDRDRIVQELQTRDILVNVSYPWPISIMRAYADLGYREGDLPVTEATARQIFSLPLYPTLRGEEQDAVCQALEEIRR